MEMAGEMLFLASSAVYFPIPFIFNVFNEGCLNVFIDVRSFVVDALPN